MELLELTVFEFQIFFCVCVCDSGSAKMPFYYIHSCNFQHEISKSKYVETMSGILCMLY